MARPKGSKNKSTVLKQGADILAQIAEKEAVCAAMELEISELEQQLEAIRDALKERKAVQKAAAKELAALQAYKEKAEREALEAAKRVELSELIQKLMDEGMSAGDIMEKLK